jgi:diaminohydroxyphosphoribosylaminopyrimidine deaminase/5-amino-6-(5-phosphoribosylamino)uracil reductase
MRLALDEAIRGTGHVSPNPRVGCVIVHGDEVVASGYHARHGEAHAEVNALSAFHGDPSAVTMYVTLEPCAHHGKQGPCTEAIIASGIRRIVVGMIDPYHEVAGRGIRRLRDAGCDVIIGVLEDECRWMNRWFAHHVTTGRSYVLGKIATSIDGAVTVPAESGRWITSPESRRVVHALRGELDAVMTGIGTVHADDPMLNVRDAEGRDPIRIVLDTHLRIPITSQIVRSAAEIPTIVICGVGYAATSEADALRSCGVDVLECPLDASGRLDLHEVLRRTGARGIASILLEAGPELTDAFLREGCMHELHVHMAPRIVANGPRWFSDVPPRAFSVHSVHSVGPDVHIHYHFRTDVA